MAFVTCKKGETYLHVSNIICSSSGGALQKRLGILRACSVPGTANRHASSIPIVVCVAPPEDEQIMLKHLEAVNLG
jgi:hypothetical protein